MPECGEVCAEGHGCVRGAGGGGGWGGGGGGGGGGLGGFGGEGFGTRALTRRRALGLLLSAGRGEFNSCQTTSCPIPLKGGREHSVITQRVLMAAILTI